MRTLSPEKSEKQRAYVREWKERNREKVRAYQREFSRKQRQPDYQKHLGINLDPIDWNVPIEVAVCTSCLRKYLTKLHCLFCV